MLCAILNVMLLLCCCNSIKAISNCPISNSFETTSEPHHYNYPVQYFQKGRAVHSSTYNCSVRLYGQASEASICYMDRQCPIRNENIINAMRGQSWLAHSEALRVLASTTDYTTRHHSKLVILGGSMTLGKQAEGCGCDDPRVDRRCKHARISLASCAWPSLFTSWTKERFSTVNFTVLNFAKGGATSGLMAQMLGHFLGPQRLTSADIVFIDHSVNDARTHSLQEVEEFEILVRCILAASNASSVPMVVVIEQQYADNSGAVPPKYVGVYRNISRHYGLHVISLRDVYASYYGDQQHGVGELYPFDPATTYMHKHVHPGWHAHLFTADMLAAVFEKKLSDLLDGKNTVERSAVSYIPPPEYYPGIDASLLLCDENTPYYLDASPKVPVKPADLDIYETTQAAAHGWREYVDTHVAGWIINNRSAVDKRALSFDVPQLPTNSSVLLKIVYMRSYVGFGSFSVWLCGRRLDKLDGLWPNAVRPHVLISVPVFYAYALGLDDLKRCAAPTERALNANEESYISWQLRLVYEIETSFATVRRHAKVKVMQVQMCAKKI